MPEDRYRLCVYGAPDLDPGGQCKWIRTCAETPMCFTFLFRRERRKPEPEREITLTVRDTNFPNIIPINGGITYMAAQDRTITFTNGVAENIKLPIGTYTFQYTTIPGYTNATGTDFTVTKDTESVTIYLTAAGELVVNVVDDLGDPITDGLVQLAAPDGTPIGAPTQIGETGEASFSEVPYDTASPVTIKVAQPMSDETHDPIEEPQDVLMDAAAVTAEIVNQRKEFELDANVEDAVYPGILPLSGDVIVNG